MTKIKFGTDGWRAIIAKEYTVDNVARVSLATAEWLTKKSLISSFTKLLNSKNYRDQQIKDVNFYLPNIESNKSPYDISVNRILDII